MAVLSSSSTLLVLACSSGSDAALHEGRQRAELTADSVAEERVLDPAIRREGATTPTSAHVDIATDGASYLAVWATGGEVFGTRVAPDGTAQDDPPRSFGMGVAPVATFDGGAYVVTWQQGAETLLRRLGSDGTSLDSAPVPLGPLSSRRPALAGDGELVVARCGGAGIELVKVMTAAATPSTSVIGSLPLTCDGAAIACTSPRSCAVLTRSTVPTDQPNGSGVCPPGECWHINLDVTTVALDELGAATAVATERVTQGYIDNFYGWMCWIDDWSISADRTGPEPSRRYGARWLNHLLGSGDAPRHVLIDYVATVDPAASPPVVTASAGFTHQPPVGPVESEALLFDGRAPAVLTVSGPVTLSRIDAVTGARTTPFLAVRPDEAWWLPDGAPSAACAGPDNCMLGLVTHGVPRAKPFGGPPMPARPLVWRSPQRQTTSAVAYVAGSDLFLTAFWDHAESDPARPSGALRVNRVDRDGAVLDASQPVAAMRGFDALAAVGRTNDAFLAWGQVGSVVGGFVSADGSMQGEAATLFAIDSSVRVKELVAAGPAENGEMLVAALLVHDGYWGGYRRDFYGQFYYEIRAVRVGPTGTVLSPPVTLASAVNGPDGWEGFWVQGSLGDLRIASSKGGFYVAWNDSVPPLGAFDPVPAHAQGLAWHAGHESPSAVQPLGGRLAGLTATRDQFIVSTDRLIRVSFTNDAIQEDRVSLRSGELLFDGSSAFMLAWDPTSAVPKADLFVVGPAGLEPTTTRLDLLSSDGVQHASDGHGRTLLTYRHSSDSEARVMERLLTTALRPDPPDAGADAHDADAHDADADARAPTADDGATPPAPMPDASTAPGNLGGERQPDPAPAAARLADGGGDGGGGGGACTFAPPRGHDGTGGAATFIALIASSFALRRRLRRRAV